MTKNTYLKLSLISLVSLTLWSLVFFPDAGILRMWEGGAVWANVGFALALACITWVIYSFDSNRTAWAPWGSTALVMMSYSFLLVKAHAASGRPELFFVLGAACCAVSISEVTAQHVLQGE